MTEVLPSKHYSHSPEYSSSNSSNSQPPSDDDETAVNTISPLISHDRRLRTAGEELEQHDKEEDQNRAQLSVLALLLAAFRKSLVTCRADREDSSSCSMEISWPTNVRHVAHVTFDRYNGFLGLPVEFELEVPRRVPSASASVFGVSAESMQCSYDSKGNSVPTILLLMQQRLYAQGGLKAEGIFRINAENSQEEHVRNQLNKGIVPHDIDLHCLAGLIKAWFRELPRGVLDSLTPEQVMQCNTEEECLELVNLLPPTQAGLLNWAINLMADVVQEEQFNKMNSRNIAMVFAPNMTQMADPLTALMYAVQVMNFLKTLIQRTLRERQEAALDPISVSSCRDPHDDNGHDNVSNGLIRNCEESDGIDEDERARGSVESFVESYGTGNQSVNDIEESFLTFQSVNDIEESFLTFSEKDTIDEGELPHDSRVDNFSSSDSPGNEMKKSGGAKLEVVDSDDNLGVKKGTQMSYSENNHWKASTSECDSFGIHEVKYNSFQRNNVEINKGVRKDYPQCMIQVLQPTEKPKGISVINHINQQVERAEAWR